MESTLKIMTSFGRFNERLLILSALIMLSGLISDIYAGVAADSVRILLKGASAAAVGPGGDIFIIERAENRIIRCAETDGTFRITGEYSWKDPADNYPRDLNAANGLDIYVADYNNHRILRFDRNLNLVSALPPEDRDPDSERIFGYPKSVAVDRFGSLYVLDGENNRVLKIGKGNSVERSLGGYDAGKGRLISPDKVRVSDRDLVYVQDQNKIVVFDIFGNYIRTLGSALFSTLKTFAVDGNTIYASEECNIFVLNEYGASIDTIRLVGSDPAVECGEMVDMDVKQGGLYILTEHSLMISRMRKKPVGDSR